jgi:SAM-dependent methyltransferase
MSTSFGPGLHVAAGRPVGMSEYDRYIGRWSRLFVPAVLAAAEVAPGHRVLDISTGTGEAASVTLPIVDASGFVVGADISPAMLAAARARLPDPGFWPVAADGQALPFKDGSFDSVICQLGLQFFRSPARGLAEFRRVLRSGGWAAICVVSTADRAPMWGFLANALSRILPAQRNILQLTFALADRDRLERLLGSAGFRDVRVDREEREDIVVSFDDYWGPIEAGIGIMPQAYLALPDADRRSVHDEVTSQLSRFEVNGHLRLSIEMLIGQGRA